MTADLDLAKCIVIEGEGHVFGYDETIDRALAQAHIPEDVPLVRGWEVRFPLGRAQVTRFEKEMHVRAWLPAVDDHGARWGKPPYLDVTVGIALAVCRHLSIAVSAADERSAVEYVSVVDVPLGAPQQTLPYRLTQVPAVLEDDPMLRASFTHVGLPGGVTEWWHNDDPVLSSAFPSDQEGVRRCPRMKPARWASSCTRS